MSIITLGWMLAVRKLRPLVVTCQTHTVICSTFSFSIFLRKSHLLQPGDYIFSLIWRILLSTTRRDTIKEALYRISCGANILGDGGVHTLSDNSAFVNPAGQLLLPGGVRPEWVPSA